MISFVIKLIQTILKLYLTSQTKNNDYTLIAKQILYVNYTMTIFKGLFIISKGILFWIIKSRKLIK